MVPRTALLLGSSFLLAALVNICSAGRPRPRLLQEEVPAGAGTHLAVQNGSVPHLENLPPGVNLTAIAESLPEDTKPEDLAALATAGSLPSILADLPPNVNWTVIAESLPEDAKQEDLAALAALAKQEDLAARANGQNKTDLSTLAGVALPKMNIPDLPDVSIPDFALPPIPSPKVTVFGHEFIIPLNAMLGGHS